MSKASVDLPEPETPVTSVSEPSVLYDVRDGIAKMKLNVPDKLNALGVGMLDALADTLDRCAEDTDVRVLVLEGAGRGFCAGADLTDRTQAEGEPADLVDDLAPELAGDEHVGLVDRQDPASAAARSRPWC